VSLASRCGVVGLAPRHCLIWSMCQGLVDSEGSRASWIEIELGCGDGIGRVGDGTRQPRRCCQKRTCVTKGVERVGKDGEPRDRCESIGCHGTASGAKAEMTEIKCSPSLAGGMRGVMDCRMITFLGQARLIRSCFSFPAHHGETRLPCSLLGQRLS